VAYKNYQVLGIGVAFSPNLRANLYEAARLSKMLKATLVLVHVGAESEEKKQQIEQIIHPQGEPPVTYRLVFKIGKPVEAIVEAVKENNIDLLLLGALKEERFVKFYLGSIARKITRAASCSVLLMINPSLERAACQHVVVNGFEDEHTADTIHAAFHVANSLGSKQLTIVEEIASEEVSIRVEDDRSLRRLNLLKEKIKRKQELRVQKIIQNLPDEVKQHTIIKTQPIFGKRGYSIGHYAQIVRADLLVMNAPNKNRFSERFFPHDVEYILNELPTDVLLVR
jgi:nucleotide-binding universal stress UspA family protein